MIDRPTWDEYFINLAFAVSHRSDDQFKKIGSVLVNRDNHVIGCGYNGLVRGINESHVDIYNRDKRRPYMIHSEINCLANTIFRPSLNDKITMYVTAHACTPCLAAMINYGVNRLVQVDMIGSIVNNNMSEEEIKYRKDLIEISGIEIVNFDKDNKWVIQNINNI